MINSKYKKKMIKIFYIIVLCAFIIISMKSEILTLYWKIVPDKLQINFPLSEKEKKQDFNNLFSVLNLSMPMIGTYQKKFKVNINSKKKIYCDYLKTHKSDFDFFSLMIAVFNDIPSFHTDLIGPEDSYYGLHCYNSRNLLSLKGVGSSKGYWNKLIKDEYKKNESLKYAQFDLIDGEYITSSIETDEKFDIKEGSKLLKINGASTDDYLIKALSIYKLFYLENQNKLFRREILFNDKKGEKVTLEIQDKQGNIIIKNMYADLGAELTHWYFAENDKSDTEDITFYKYKSISYIKFDSFNNEIGDKVCKHLKEINTDDIIIDLRDNYGGNTSFAKNYLYPYLFNKNIDNSYTWYMLNSENNKKVYDSIYSRFLLNLKSTDDNLDFLYGDNNYLKSNVKSKYTSKSKNKLNIYILTSHNTGSAADGFVSLIKNNHLGVIIGENTGGEGLAGSFMSDILKNSKLVYTYMPSVGFNKDGSDNSIYGNSPNVFVTLSQEDFHKKERLLKENKNIYVFKNMIIWDTQLKKALEIISKKN